MADERLKAIDLALSQIEKQFGKGSIMRLGSKEAIVRHVGRLLRDMKYARSAFRVCPWERGSGQDAAFRQIVGD